MRDEQFRKWYDAHQGFSKKSAESFAYDAWCEAWWQATKPKMCICESVELCNLHDKCMKGSK